MSHTQSARCPQCGERATSSADHSLKHGAMHSLSHGLQHGNPLYVSVGALAAGIAAVRSHWFRCKTCGKGFFAR